MRNVTKMGYLAYSQKMYRKKYLGCLLGGAIGDALGMQTEGLSPLEIIHRFNKVYDYGPGRPGTINEKLRPGQYTDDTEQTIILARSIIKKGRLDPEDFSRGLMEHFEKIRYDSSKNRGWGSSSLAACERMQAGIPWQESGSDTPTCGSSMRVSPIGLLYPGQPEKIESIAKISSLPTHKHPGSIGGAIAVAAAVSMAVTTTYPKSIIETISDLAGKYDPLLGKKLGLIEKLRYMEPINAFSTLGSSIMTTDVVPAAIYCFARNPLNFPQALITAVNAGGDTDSIAAITGAVSGAYLGIDAIPQKWLNRLENRDEIKQLALELWEIGKHNIKENM